MHQRISLRNDLSIVNNLTQVEACGCLRCHFEVYEKIFSITKAQAASLALIRNVQRPIHFRIFLRRSPQG